jgi:hypothetical protein
MSFFDMKFASQILAFAFVLLAMLVILTTWSSWLINLLKSKFKNDVPTYWSVGVSFLAMAATTTIGKAEPFWELTMVAAANLIAWWLISRKNCQRAVRIE